MADPLQTRIPIYLAHNPAGTSIRNMVHYAQMVHHKRFAPYDRGVAVNEKLYGAVSFLNFISIQFSIELRYGIVLQPFAPEFDISQVGSPTYLFYSEADW